MQAIVGAATANRCYNTVALPRPQGSSSITLGCLPQCRYHTSMMAGAILEMVIWGVRLTIMRKASCEALSRIPIIFWWLMQSTSVVIQSSPCANAYYHKGLQIHETLYAVHMLFDDEFTMGLPLRLYSSQFNVPNWHPLYTCFFTTRAAIDLSL
jgi:hypothetical protein